MSSTLAEAVEAAHLSVRDVEGWVGPEIWRCVQFIGELHEAHAVRGDLMEIGVHHGKLFLILAALLRPYESLTAVDLFEDQDLNVDRSGHGSRAILERHIDALCPQRRGQLRLVQADSMALTGALLGRVATPNGFRVISVDGGHTVAHVLNDLSFAQDHLSPMGVVILDDFCNAHWPGVAEGFFRFMDTRNRRLVPFAHFQNKLLLTTFSEHLTVLWAFRQFIDRHFGERVNTEWRMPTLCGHQILAWSA